MTNNYTSNQSEQFKDKIIIVTGSTQGSGAETAKLLTSRGARGITICGRNEDKGNKVDCVDLYKEKFNPIFAGEEPDSTVLDHRKRIEKSDVIVLVAPIWNFRMPAMVEGWIDKVLSPPWAFSFKKLFGN